MITIEATTPCRDLPPWALLERALLDAMSQAVYPFLDKYTRADGTLIWGESLPDRGDADDFYESFGNWPLLYLLGGADDLLPLAERQWEAVTRQLTAIGNVFKEYERGYDQFHQSESYVYFYFLCMADPTNPRLVDRARRFAGLYLGEDPEAPNYDPVHRIIRAPHNGSGGPRWGWFDEDDPAYHWRVDMEPYGLPYDDVPGVSTYADLKDPALARRMGAVMQDRLGKGDVAPNLAVTSLVTNAYLMTGDEKYPRWVVDYVDAWWERARQNGGLLPDNVGLTGQVGEYMGGKWYGGLYGWTWPHGFYNIEKAALVAAGNAFLLTANRGYLDLPRHQLDRIAALGVVRDPRDLAMSLRHHWIGQIPEGRQLHVVPYRYGDRGWFDYQPLSPIDPVALWNLSLAADDWERIEALRRTSPYDWRQVVSGRTKEDSGHEQPWLRFLAGDNPAYPETILRESFYQVALRLEQIRRDTEDLTAVPEDLVGVKVHHWQLLNPVTTEALVQLTLGAPQSLLNGGLLHCTVRYFDLERRRPGLPKDVSALVERVEAERATLRLVNTSPFHARDVVIQAGGFGEHRFVAAHYAARSGEYPGPIGGQPGYATTDMAREAAVGHASIAIGDRHLHVHLPPAMEIAIDLELERHVLSPSYALPWQPEVAP